MTDAILEQRVTTLEDLMAELLRTVNRVDRQIEQTQHNLDQLSDEVRVANNELNKKWGDLANKMGTLAEDLVAPSVPRILRTLVGCPNNTLDRIAVRVQQRHPATGQMREFDVIAVCGETVLINETKSSLGSHDIAAFADLLPTVREFFPEYMEMKFVGAIASLHVDPGVIRYGERAGLIVLGFGEGVMQILNSPEFTPKQF